jgi:hypothetical protein
MPDATEHALTMTGVSRQRDWQVARIAAGRCATCGKPREPQSRMGATAYHCARCAAHSRECKRRYAIRRRARLKADAKA